MRNILTRIAQNQLGSAKLEARGTFDLFKSLFSKIIQWLAMTRFPIGAKNRCRLERLRGVKIGKNCAFAAQVGIAGGAIIGDGVILAGQVGVTNRVKVGNNVVASAKCGIHCDINDGEVISGFPAMKNKGWLRSSSIFKKLPELAKKLRQLDNR